MAPASSSARTTGSSPRPWRWPAGPVEPSSWTTRPITCPPRAPRSPGATSSLPWPRTCATECRSGRSASPSTPASLVPGVIPVPREEPSGLVAEVLWVDHFGNAQLNVGPDDVAGLGRRRAPVVGGHRPHRARRHDLRRDRGRRGRAGARLLRAHGRVAHAALGGRRARAGPGRRDHALRRRRGGRLRPHRAGWSCGARAGSPGSLGPCAPPPRSPWPCCWWPSSWPACSAWCSSEPDPRLGGRRATTLESCRRRPRGGRRRLILPASTGTPVNIASIIDGHPDGSPALVSQSRITTYGALRDRCDALRGALASLGVSAGDRVAMLCGNDPYFAIALLATVGMGAVAVPLNPTSPGPELERQLSEVTPVGRGRRGHGRGGVGVRAPVGHRRHLHRGGHAREPHRGGARLRGPAGRGAASRRRPPGGHAGAAHVHERDGRIVGGGHAVPREPPGQPGADPLGRR